MARRSQERDRNSGSQARGWRRAATRFGAPGPSGPPGPRAPGVVQTALLFRDPMRVLGRWHRMYGDVFQISLLGIPRLVYVADAELARKAFATDRDIGRAGAARRGFVEPLVGAHSLLCLDGDDWMRQRKLLGSAFHGKRIDGYRKEIAGIAASEIERWPLGEPFTLRPRMQAITLEVILRVVFGVRDSARVRKLRALLPALVEAAEMDSVLAQVLSPRRWQRIEPALRRIPRSPQARFASLLAETDVILYDEISARRRAPDVDERADILSVLLRARDDEGRGPTDAELRDGLMTLLVAGHETTSTALAWTFERLVRHPRVLERLAGAMRSTTPDAAAEAYLEAVVREVLRVRPVVADMPRVLTEDLDLGGYRVPAGSWVTPVAPLIHRVQSHFPEPDSFQPERFLGQDVSWHAWVPFGGGRRQCLGSHFAVLEMKAVVEAVLARLDLSVAGSIAPEPQRIRGVTLCPARDGYVVARATIPVAAGSP